jgi:peptide-methionine (S)-S-oxide reductase
MDRQKAMFGAGCFWHVEAAFCRLPGVATQVGYSGGDYADPTYQDVCSGKTGHAEVVLVEYDPGETTYEQLLDLFWESHDPTTRNRQGPDVGSQYRSAIFYFNPEQEQTARESLRKQEESGKFRGPVVTEITGAGPFYRAEEYHQKYFQKTGRASCGF